MFKNLNKYFWPGLVITILLTTLAIWFQGESKNSVLLGNERTQMVIESNNTDLLKVWIAFSYGSKKSHIEHTVPYMTFFGAKTEKNLV